MAQAGADRKRVCASLRIGTGAPGAVVRMYYADLSDLVPQPTQQRLGVALVKGHPADPVVVLVDGVKRLPMVGQQPLGLGVAQVAVVVGSVKDGVFVGAVHLFQCVVG